MSTTNTEEHSVGSVPPDAVLPVATKILLSILDHQNISTLHRQALVVLYTSHLSNNAFSTPNT